jgi:D-3-phosphoglycerate dehydrogenase
MKNVLLPERLGDEGESMLEGRVNVLRSAGTDERALCEAAGAADGVVLRSKARITEAVLLCAPDLRVVSRTGVGVDNVDVDACTRHGVIVCFLPGINAYAVAEHTVALMLALLKQLPLMDRVMRAGARTDAGTVRTDARRDAGAVRVSETIGAAGAAAEGWNIRSRNIPQDAYGKTLGILGLGRVGREVAARAAAFGMEIIGYDPYVRESEGVAWMEPDEVIAKADVLTLHLPETDETRGFMDAGRISRMKPTSFLINTSRGGVVDQDALTDALRNRRISGAALDVFRDEPPGPGDAQLLALDNVILTPHVAALTEQCGTTMMREAVRQLLTVLDGGVPPNVFNAEALKAAGFIK